MNFNDLVKEILEQSQIEEDKFDSSNDLHFSGDILSNKSAEEIADGLLKASNYNTTVALQKLDNLEKKDGLFDKEKIKKAKNKILDNVSYIYEKINKSFVTEAENNSKEGQYKQKKQDIEKLFNALKTNGLSPALIDTSKGNRFLLFFSDEHNKKLHPYYISGCDIDENNKTIFSLTSIGGSNGIVEINKTPNEIKEKLNNPDIETKKYIEWFDHYYSNLDEIKEKIDDLDFLRNRLLEMAKNDIKLEYATEYSEDIGLSESKFEEFLDVIMQEGSEFNLRDITSQFNMDKKQATKLFKTLAKDKILVKPSKKISNNFLFNWEKVGERAQKIYKDALENTSTNTDNNQAYNLDSLLVDLLADSEDDMSIQKFYKKEEYPYYWQQLIRTVGDNMSTFTTKRFMPYYRNVKPETEILEDEIITNQYNDNKKIKPNYAVDLIIFFNKFKDDLTELYLIQNDESETYKSQDQIKIQDPASATIFSPEFQEYKTLKQSEYQKKNSANNELKVTDRFVAVNFVEFQNNLSPKESGDYDLIKQQKKYANFVFSKDEDVSLNGYSSNDINSFNLVFNKKDIEQIKNNIKSATSAKFVLDIESGAEDSKLNLINNVWQCLGKVIENNSDNEEEYIKLFATFLSAFNFSDNDIKDWEKRYQIEDAEDQVIISEALRLKNSENPYYFQYQDGKYQLIGVDKKLGRTTETVVSALCKKWNKENKDSESYFDYEKIKTINDLDNSEYFYVKIGDENYKSLQNIFQTTIGNKDLIYIVKNLRDIWKSAVEKIKNDYKSYDIKGAEDRVTMPDFTLQCINDNVNYDMALKLNMENLMLFIEGKTLKKDFYKLFTNPMSSVLKKMNPDTEKIKNQDRIQELTKTRVLYLFMEKMGEIFYPNDEIKRLTLTRGMGAVPIQIGASADQLYRILSLKYDSSLIHVEYEETSVVPEEEDMSDSQLPLDKIIITKTNKDGSTQEIEATEEDKQMLRSAIEMKMMLYSDLLGDTGNGDDSRKDTKTPTLKILFGDLLDNLECHFSEDIEAQENIENKIETYNVLANQGKKVVDEYYKKLKWLYDSKFFEDGAELDSQLKTLKESLPKEVISQLRNLYFLYQETNVSYNKGSLETSQYSIWLPDTRQLSRWRGQNYEHKSKKKKNIINKSFGVGGF